MAIQRDSEGPGFETGIAMPATPIPPVPATASGIPISPAPSTMRESQTFLNVKSNAVLDAEAEAKTQADQLLTQEAPRNDLSAYIEKRFKEATDAKTEQTEKIMGGLRRRKGEYDAARLAEIKKQGGSEIFMKLTEAKCNSAEAWFSDIVVPVEGRPWKITPSPLSKLPWQVIKSVTDQVMRQFMTTPGAVNPDDVAAYATTLADLARAELYNEARELAIQAGKASASLMQRRLKVGYARAARLLDLLEAEGVIGPADGAKPRDVLVSPDDYLGP